MLHRIFHTRDDHLLTLLRICLGIIFFAHGAQKVFGWWGGPGYSASVGYFTAGFGLPSFLAILAILTEFLGGIALVLGLLTRIAGIGIAIEMAVAIALVHAQYGFFMNWSGAQGGEGFEYHILAIAIAVTLAAHGAGAWSFDRLIDRGYAGAHGHPHFREPLPHHG